MACGLFAKSHGEEFLFFMPQVRVVRTTSGGYNQLPVDAWLPFSPYFWVPLFVILFAAAVLVAGPKAIVSLGACSWQRGLADSDLCRLRRVAVPRRWLALQPRLLLQLLPRADSPLPDRRAGLLIGSRVSPAIGSRRDRLCCRSPRAGHLDLPNGLGTPHGDRLRRRFVRRDVRGDGRRDPSCRSQLGCLDFARRCSGRRVAFFATPTD